MRVIIAASTPPPAGLLNSARSGDIFIAEDGGRASCSTIEIRAGAIECERRRR